MSQSQAIKFDMRAEDVLDLVTLFEQNQIEVILEGGWGVDALLGEQTRLHEDLDIAMPHNYVPLARSLLEARGYADVPRPDTRDCNFVLGDKFGHLIDFHTYTFDELVGWSLGCRTHPIRSPGPARSWVTRCDPSPRNGWSNSTQAMPTMKMTIRM